METKKWYQSKTIWGIIVGAVGFLMATLGVDSPVLPANADFEQLKAYADAIKASQGSLPVIIGQLMGVIGTILSIVGRMKADTKVTV